MELIRQDSTPSPDRDGFQRVSVDVRARGSKEVLDFWFDVPSRHASHLSRSGDPWVVMLMPMAMATGEAIEVPSPVDPHLVDNLLGLMRVWQAWYPHLRPVEIRAPLAGTRSPTAGRRGLCFSGGIDSFFSLLRHVHGTTGDAGGAVDDLVNVAGFDLPLTETEELARAEGVLEGVADRFDKTLVRVFTNLRTRNTCYETDWMGSHACALAAVGHLLGRYDELVIASSYDYGHLDPPIGSHPMTDPLLGSRSMRIVHDGASFTRVEKTALVSRSDVALDGLRVCWESRRSSNCSECRKCLITMVTLDLLDSKERARTFEWSRYDLKTVRSLPLASDSQVIMFQGIAEEARSSGRLDIVEAVTECLRNNRRRRRIGAVTRRLGFEGTIRGLLANTSLWKSIKERPIGRAGKRLAGKWI